MSGEYPTNMRALDAEALHVLSHAGALAIYLAVCERPVLPRDLGRVSGRPLADALARAESLVRVGLLRLVDGRYVPGARHVREEDLDGPGKVAFRMGILGAAIGAVEDAKRAFRLRREHAKAGIAMVTLPDRPDVVARSIAIIAEAEDQLRALAEEAGDGEPRLRYVFFSHTMPPEPIVPAPNGNGHAHGHADLSNTPQ